MTHPQPGPEDTLPAEASHVSHPDGTEPAHASSGGMDAASVSAPAERAADSSEAPARSFRRWRRTRPFTAGLLTMLGGLGVLAGPLSLVRLATLPGSSIPIGIAVGSLITLMGLLEWLVPLYSLMAGAITVVLALVSLLTASFGGLIIGMLLSLAGGAMAVAWRPVQPAQRGAHAQDVPTHPTPPDAPSASA